MELKAGTSKNLTGSMAEDIQEAFLNTWPTLMGDVPKPAPSDQMKLLFIAVAQGVVKHLKEHPDAFKITVKLNETTFNADVKIEGT